MTHPINVQLKYIGFGSRLGAMIAAIDVITTITILHWMGDPDYLIRPGSELVYAIFMIFSGFIVGVLYGLILSLFATLSKRRIRQNLTLIFSLATALFVYSVSTVLMIHFQIIRSSPFITHGIVLVFSLVLAVATSCSCGNGVSENINQDKNHSAEQDDKQAIDKLGGIDKGDAKGGQ